jgi:TonB family protein
MNWSFWLELLARSAALLVAGEALRRASKRQSAAFRHKLLLWVFALLALLPVLSLVFPEIRVPLRRAAHAETAVVTVQEVSRTVVDRPVRHDWNWPLWIWLGGAALAFAPMAMGAISASRMAGRAMPFASAAVRNAVEESSEGRASCAEVLISSELSVPLTCGFLRPRILLPGAAARWDDARVEAVLLHELAHVRRRDVAAQVAVHAIAALWWFQPLVWMLRQKLRAESELACDEEALRSGFRRSAYAAELLGVAKAMGGRYRLSSAAISMTRAGDLEERVRAILNPPGALGRPLRKLGIAAALAAMTVSAAALSLGSNQDSNEQGGLSMKRVILSALLTSAGLTAATISGLVHDASGTAMPEVKVLISNPDTGTKQEATTSSDGRFSFGGNGPGQYILRLEKSGYTSIFREFDVKADSKVEREFTMTNEGGQPVADKVVGASEEQPKRVRGTVAEANLTTKVQPIYPEAAKGAGVQGTVNMEVTISKDGVPTEVRVLSSPSDDLSESAIEAVRQWRYRPALLNGEPVGIVTDVIVNYTLTR